MREQLRRETDAPRCMTSTTASDAPKRAIPRSEKALPKRAKDLSANAEATWAKSHTEIELPKRTTLLRDIDEPN